MSVDMVGQQASDLLKRINAAIESGKRYENALDNASKEDRSVLELQVYKLRVRIMGDVHQLADQLLELEKDKSYRVHLSSMDWQHGFSLQPVNINLQVHPDYDMVVTLTPNETGEFGVVCNEFCGIGHHLMLGKIYVVE